MKNARHKKMKEDERGKGERGKTLHKNKQSFPGVIREKT